MANKTQEQIMQNWGGRDLPLLSVCCITFNHEGYIAEALDSFLMQETDFPFEVIVRDDCSADRTAEIIRTYEQQYPLIIKPIYEAENQYSKGVRPMPVVFKQTKGEYLALCDGDDYWTDQHKLQHQVDFLAAHLDYSVCYTAANIINDEGKQIGIINEFGDSDEKTMISGLGSVITGSMMFRRFDLSEWMGLANVKVFNGDAVLWHFLGFHGKCKCLDNIGNTAYRVHSGGVWGGVSSHDKFVRLLGTYSVIRTSILNKLPNDLEVLAMNDVKFSIIFEWYFFISVRSMSIREYVFCLKKLVESKELNRTNIYIYHVIKILKRAFKKLFR